MKFFAISALATVAVATNTYYGGARIATTGLTGLSTGYTTGYSTLAAPALATGYTTGYSTLAAPALTTGYTTLAAPAIQKVVAVSQPAIAVQKVGLAATNFVNAGYAGGYTYGQAAVSPLAIQTSHQVQYADVPSGGQINPISVEIDANPIPINMLFRSASSQLNVQQAHQGAAGSVQESASEDETHVLKHSVTKPVLQEVREVVTPFRRITQEVQPVQEQIQTIVARGVNKAVLAAPVATQVVSAPVATQVVAAPVATQVLAAPVASYQKVISAPLATTQLLSAPVASVQKVISAPLLQKTYGAVNTLVKEY